METSSLFWQNTFHSLYWRCIEIFLILWYIVYMWEFPGGIGWISKTIGKTYIVCLLMVAVSVFWVPWVYASTCWDGNKEVDETCDDGNLLDGDGCDGWCMIEEWYTCEVPEVSFDGLDDSDVDGAGTWVPDADGLGVTETRNTNPGIVNIEPDAMNKLYNLRFGVLTASDDDMIWIALGYNPWEFSNWAGYDYLIYDRKQNTQTISSAQTAPRWTRLWVARWTNTSPRYRWFDNPLGWWVTAFDRGDVYGSVWWADNTLYDLDILYTSTSLQIWIDWVLDVDIVPSDFPTEFPTGEFPIWWIWFYAYSQAQARFEIIPQVTSFCQDFCSNGVLSTQGEECDDNNLINNDWCSSTCEIEYCRDDAPLHDTSKNFAVTQLSPTAISWTSSQPNSKVVLCFEDTTWSRNIYQTSTNATWAFSYTPDLSPYMSPWLNVWVMLHDENWLDIDHHAMVMGR